MNRRSFLMALGAGSLSLAGKFPPPKPTFIVEIEVNSDKVWVNGKSPEKPWTHNNGVYNLDFEAKGLVIAGVTFDSLKIENNNSCDCEYQSVGAKVTLKNSKGTFHGKITKTVDQRLEFAKEKNPKVKLYNGEELELHDDQRYFRIDF